MLASLLSLSPAAFADKPLRIVVPFQAGSATDAAARILGDHLGKIMNRSVMVDNKPGAEGLIAAREVINATPDGHVLLFSTNPAITASNTFYPKPHFEPLTDLTAIARAAQYPFLSMTRSDLPFKKAEDFITYARAKPNEMNYAAGSSSSLLAMAQLVGSADLDMHYIPYNSEPPAVVDLMGGRIDVMFATPTTTKGFLDEGKLNALMTTHSTRLDLFPDVPTMPEAGFEELSLLAWGGFFGPGKMHPETRKRLSDQVLQVIADTKIVAALKTHNIVVSPMGSDAFHDFVKNQLQLSAQVVEEHGLMRK